MLFQEWSPVPSTHMRRLRLRGIPAQGSNAFFWSLLALAYMSTHTHGDTHTQDHFYLKKKKERNGRRKEKKKLRNCVLNLDPKVFVNEQFITSL